jgi:hypothetical protein
MTFKAAHTMISLIDDRQAREHEIRERFQMTMKDFETRNGARDSELRATQIRHVYRPRATAPWAVPAGAVPPSREAVAAPNASARQRHLAPPPWRESDPDTRPWLNYKAAGPTWADPFADAPRWYDDKKVKN